LLVQLFAAFTVARARANHGEVIAPHPANSLANPACVKRAASMRTFRHPMADSFLMPPAEEGYQRSHHDQSDDIEQ
jgi:hypothetical protein